MHACHLTALLISLFVCAGRAVAECPERPACRKASQRVIDLKTELEVAKYQMVTLDSRCHDNESDEACTKRLAAAKRKAFENLALSLGKYDAAKSNLVEACCLDE